MAVRIRRSGEIFCAAMSGPEEGDTYLNDGLHYRLSVELKVLVTECFSKHVKSGGQWWWKDQVPNDIEIDLFYLL